MRKRLRKPVEAAVDVFSAANVEVAGTDPESSHVWWIEGFRSAILTNERDLWVYVPRRYGYDNPARYPVLYLQDGQDLFVDAASSSGHSWKVQSKADQAIASGEAAPMIIVGIKTTESRRMREYTPSPDRKHPHGGGADSYVHFLVDEVKPRIDTLFRTQPQRDSTAIGGSSLGALVSLWAALKWPDVFSTVAAMSPSVWWDDRMIVRVVDALRTRPDLKVWLDIGSAEGAAAIDGARALRRAMLAKGWRDGVDFRFTEVDRGKHNALAWGRRLPDVLTFLFPATS